MLYNLSKDQLDKVMKTNKLSEFSRAEMLLASFQTDAEVVRKILPKPLKPAPKPSASAFVARYPQTNFGCVYNEGALFLDCDFKGERGTYCLSMPVDDDMAMIGGREIFGYPKKMAEKITLERNGDQVIGSVIRKGTELGVDYGLTSSCYDPSAEGRACGRCDACLLRLRGFREAGLFDPVSYLAPDV